jgi:hypothetical protein
VAGSAPVTRQGPDTAVLPRRIRPGFWDDNARCCGTAGVLALACDRVAEHGGDLDGYCRGNLAAACASILRAELRCMSIQARQLRVELTAGLLVIDTAKVPLIVVPTRLSALWRLLRITSPDVEIG